MTGCIHITVIGQKCHKKIQISRTTASVFCSPELAVGAAYIELRFRFAAEPTVMIKAQTSQTMTTKTIRKEVLVQLQEVLEDVPIYGTLCCHTAWHDNWLHAKKNVERVAQQFPQAGC